MRNILYVDPTIFSRIHFYDHIEDNLVQFDIDDTIKTSLQFKHLKDYYERIQFDWTNYNETTEFRSELGAEIHAASVAATAVSRDTGTKDSNDIDPNYHNSSEFNELIADCEKALEIVKDKSGSIDYGMIASSIIKVHQTISNEVSRLEKTSTSPFEEEKGEILDLYYDNLFPIQSGDSPFSIETGIQRGLLMLSLSDSSETLPELCNKYFTNLLQELESEDDKSVSYSVVTGILEITEQLSKTGKVLNKDWQTTFVCQQILQIFKNTDKEEVSTFFKMFPPEEESGNIKSPEDYIKFLNSVDKVKTQLESETFSDKDKDTIRDLYDLSVFPTEYANKGHENWDIFDSDKTDFLELYFINMFKDKFGESITDDVIQDAFIRLRETITAQFKK
jgi:hypothetical protein